MKLIYPIPHDTTRRFPLTIALLARSPAVRAMGILSLNFLLGPAARAQSILGSTGGYAVMAGSTVTINGAGTAITGDLGAANVVGTGYTLTGSQGPMIAQNQTDFTRAFLGLAAMTPTSDLSGMILGTTAGATILTPGVYHFTSTAQLTGTLILDAEGQDNAVWVFQIGSTLTTAALSAVTLINPAPNSVANDGVFWEVGSTTVFGANTTFEGNVLSGTTFSFGLATTIDHGRALSGTGETITLDGNTINYVAPDSGYSGGLAFTDSGNSVTAIPEPVTSALIAAVGTFGLALWRRRRVTR